MSDYTILQQPNVPKPLHSLAPRVIETAHWWNKQRDAMLERQDYTCKCCDTKVDHRSKLDLHEEYTINYEEGYSNVTGMIGLCKDCHAFIHNGLLFKMAQEGTRSFDNTDRIFRRGFALLRQEELEPNHAAGIHYIALLDYFGKPVNQVLRDKANELTVKQNKSIIQQNWSAWHLRWNGNKYYSLFSSQRDWENNIGKRKYER